MSASTPALRLATMFDYLHHWSATTPDAPAYIFQGTTVSYRELRNQVDAFARALLARRLGPGERVAMLSTPRPEFWVSFLATVSVGGVWVGLNPRHQQRELAHVLGDSRPTVLLGLNAHADRDYTALLAGLATDAHIPAPVVFGGTTGGWDQFLAPGRQVSDQRLAAARSAPRPQDPALIVYTSGSTGAPKGAVLSSSALAASFAIEADHQVAGTETARGIANLPINHIAGVGDLCCTLLVLGGSVVFQEHFDPRAVLDAIGTHQVTTLMQVPTMLKLIVEHPDWPDSDLASLRGVYWGGGPLPLEVARAYRNRGIHLGTTYGMTEITGSVTYTDTDAPEEVIAHTVGRPIPEVDLKLVGPDGQPVPAGVEGEVLVKHPGLLLEYFGNPEATIAGLDPAGYFKTGDIGVLRPDGNLRLVGRQQDMFKSGGYNIYPREIELVLEAHPAIKMAVVVAVPDPTYQEVGVAYCEIENTGTPPGADELAAWCRDRLANYKIPKQIQITTALPLLPVGKVDKRELAAQARTLITSTRTS